MNYRFRGPWRPLFSKIAKGFASVCPRPLHGLPRGKWGHSTAIILPLIVLSIVLSGCTTTRPVVIGPDAAFFDPERCRGWPRRDEGLSEPEYVLRGYESYRCERSSRLAAGEALKELQADH